MTNKSTNYFATGHLRNRLKERAIKSAAITVSAQVAKLALQLISIAILARLLSPSDFGLVAMVTVFSGLALQLTEGGLSMATIQRDAITHAQISNLFWVNAGLGLILCVIGILASPLVSIIYNEPQLTAIMAVTSISFLIGGVSVQHDALLRRQMHFKTLSLIDIFSMAAGIMCGIVAAVMGWGYWSLVLIPLITLLVKTLLRWWATRWLPSRPFRGSGVRPLLGFGANLTGANFIGYFATNITPFVLGVVGGTQFLGLFNRANTLTSIPTKQMLPPVMNVVQPTLARVAGEPELLKKTITSLLRKLAIFTMFVTLTMAVLADWIVLLLLGPDWLDAVPIFRMLAAFSLVEPIAGFLAVSLIAAGNSRAILQWKAITLGILIVSIAIGSAWGAFGVVTAYTVSGVCLRLPGFLFFASRFLPVGFKELIVAILPSIVCAVTTAVILYLLRQHVSFDEAVSGLFFFGAVALLAYFSMCMIFRKTREELTDTIGLVKLLISKKEVRSDKKS